MTTQLEITRFWNEGVIKCDQKDYTGALEILKKITDPTSKVTFDIGCICLLAGDLSNALRHFDVSVKKDEHMVVGFFQRGVVKYQLGRYPDALEDFSKAYSLLRGNPVIDYKQLGMKLKLYDCEILLNRAACNERLGQVNEATRDLTSATEGKSIPAHSVIDDAFSTLQCGQVIRLYQLPSDALFRPPGYKTDHMEKKNYLGKAKVLSSVKDQDSYAGFEGALKYPRSPSPTRKTVPEEVKVPVDSTKRPKSPIAPPSKLPKGTQYQAIFDFTPSTQWEIALHEDDIVIVTEKGTDGWFTATNTRTRQSGLIPESYVKPTSQGKRTSVPNIGRLSPLPNSPRRSSSPVGNISPQPPARPAPGQSSAFKPLQIARPKSPRVSPRTSPVTQRKSSHSQSRDVVVKIHYLDTRCIEVPLGTSLGDITARAQQKFEVEDKLVTLWREVGSQMVCISSNAEMMEAWRSVIDGHLTLWMYGDKVNKRGAPFLYEAEALYDYDAVQAGDLGFREGDIIEVTVEVNEEWLEGRSRGNMGIFPKSYIKRL